MTVEDEESARCMRVSYRGLERRAERARVDDHVDEGGRERESQVELQPAGDEERRGFCSEVLSLSRYGGQQLSRSSRTTIAAPRLFSGTRRLASLLAPAFHSTTRHTAKMDQRILGAAVGLILVIVAFVLLKPGKLSRTTLRSPPPPSLALCS